VICKFSHRLPQKWSPVQTRRDLSQLQGHVVAVTFPCDDVNEVENLWQFARIVVTMFDLVSFREEKRRAYIKMSWRDERCYFIVSSPGGASLPVHNSKLQKRNITGYSGPGPRYFWSRGYNPPLFRVIFSKHNFIYFCGCANSCKQSTQHLFQRYFWRSCKVNCWPHMSLSIVDLYTASSQMPLMRCVRL